ncbi:MAG: NAD(P)/FAD-dependent oxidoreductase [Verrucomicrobiota bacterium]
MSRTLQSEYTAVVIGSGPNGLAAAIHLAEQKVGDVLVLEASKTPGGGTRTKELTLPGFHHDVCSAIHPMGLASPFLSTLPLADHGIDWVHPRFPAAQPMDDGRAAVQEREIDATAERLGARDGRAYRRIYEPFTRNAKELYGDLLGPIGIPKHPFKMAGFGLPALRSARSLAFGKFETEEGRALFSGHAAHSVQPLEHPLTSAIALMLSTTGHSVGWPMAKGGSQSIANAMVSYFEKLGGEVVCDHRVDSIEDLPKAKAYIFDTSPAAMSKICGERLPSSYRNHLKRYRYGPGIFKVDWALNDPIPWINEDCRGAGTVHVGGTFDEVAAAESDAWNGRHSERPFLILSQPTVFDPTRAPEGKHTAWAYCHVPNGSTEDMLDRIESQIERYAPGFRDCILAANTMSTEDMASYNANNVGGDVVGGIADWRQLYTRPAVRWNPYSTPAKDIYICSASTPPGAGVHGMCGYHTAESAMRRLRLRG